MRAPVLALLVALAGCPASLETNALDDGNAPGAGTGGGVSAECAVDTDCVPAGPKCCDCPTHALPALDPTARACAEVGCQPQACGSPMQAACDLGRCVLECAPVACDVSCDNGYATDANGCLVCSCAGVDQTAQCTRDDQCARVRDDCCGCAMGGNDTAVPVSEVAAHEASLMCPANPSCPGVDTCAPDLAARCVQGLCALVAGPLPAGACGRADLPACPTGQVCTLNANDQATMHGVGVCI